jgi:hypothetical protein
MDIQFVLITQSAGTVYNTTQNVGNGTYIWSPSENLLDYGDFPRFYVKVTDNVWGKSQISGVNNLNVERAWIQFSKDGNSLTVTHIEPSNFSWDQIHIEGIGNKPSGVISVGDKITNCSGTVNVYWSEVNLLIDSWIF